MSLTTRISEELTAAMKAGEKLRVETLRMVRAALLELQKSGREIAAEDEMRAVQNQAKRRKDAAEQFRAAGRNDLAEKEEQELAIIEEYLPKQLSDDELRARVRAIVEETGASGPGDFKVVMPKAMAELRGVADGGRVQAMVKEALSGA